MSVHCILSNFVTRIMFTSCIPWDPWTTTLMPLLLGIGCVNLRNIIVLGRLLF